jgi:hypothetical protein
MKRFMTSTLAAVVAAGVAATAWSQAGQAGGSGGAGGAGGVGASGTAGAGGTAGTPSAAGTAGAAGQAGTPGAVPAGTAGSGVGTAANPNGQGNVGAAGAVGRAKIGQNRLSAGVGFNNNGISQTPFFMDPGARQQLNLNDSQFNALNRSYQDAFRRYNDNLRGLNNNLTEQQRMQQMQQFEAQFRNDFGRTVDTTFTDPRFRTRFDQLNRQFMGFNAFNDPAIQTQLNLTPQQRQQLRRLAADWRRQLQAGGGSAGFTQEQWNQMTSQYWDQLNSVLTPQQQQAWSQATGERFSFSPDLFRSGNNLDNGNTSGNVGVIRENARGAARIVPHSGTPQGNQNRTGTGSATPQGTNANTGTQGTTR